MKCSGKMLHYFTARWEKHGDYSKGQLKVPREDWGARRKGESAGVEPGRSGFGSQLRH